VKTKARKIMEHVFFCTGHELKIPNIVKSEGLYLYDDQGKGYMDLESGVWCTSIGHKNAELNRKIKNQIDLLMHTGFCYSNKILEKSAKSILKVAGFNNGKSVFLCSGSEAVEISRQMARHLTHKNISLTLHDSYLGAYSSIIDKSKNWYLLNWEQCKICPDKDKCNSSCDVLLNIPKDVSEFIFEPGSSSGFVRFPPKAFISKIAQIVRDNGGKIIVNEVTTGIGRTGKWFGFQHYDIIPDFVAVGKGIGNGYPVSIALINKTTGKQLERKPFHYSQSHQNDPLGASIAHGVIQYIEDNDLISKAESNGLLLHKHLESLVDNEIIIEVRGRGLMFAVDIKNEEITNFLYDDLIERGYIVGNRGSSFRIDPPLTIQKTEIDRFIEVLKESISRYKIMLETFGKRYRLS
jgi:acetylornithine aminotransferase